MPARTVSRDPIFRRWNIAILSVAIVLVTLFSFQFSAFSSPNPQASEQTGIVATDGRRLNARSGPGTDFPIIGKIEPDTSVQILDRSANGTWLQIQVELLDSQATGGEIWVAAQYIETNATLVSRPASNTSASNTSAGSTSDSSAPTATPASAAASTASSSTTTTTTSSAGAAIAGVTQLNLNRRATAIATAAGNTSPTSTASGTATSEPQAGNTESSAEVNATGDSATEEIDILALLLPTVTPTPTARQANNQQPAQQTPSSSPAATSTTAQGGNPATTELILIPTPTPATQQRTTNETGTAAGAITGTVTGTAVAAAPQATTPPTATATPMPSPTPMPTPSVPTAFTQPDRMNVRGGPGTNFEVVSSVPSGTALEILAANPAGDWYQVQISGREEPAWIFASLTVAQGPLDTIVRLSEDQLPQPPAPPEPVAAEPAAQPAAAAAPAAAVSAPAPTGGGSFGYGVQAHMVHNDQAGRVMDVTRDLGFGWVKQQIEWHVFEGTQGQIGWGSMDGIVNAANAAGINLLFSTVNAPNWAREPGFDGSVGGPPQDPATFAAFNGAIAGRYCGSSLKAIEVWNEQNLHYEWGNRPLNAAEYVALLAPSYAAIKAACPSMYVISGALTPAGNNMPYAMDDMVYLRQMFDAGLNNYMDGLGAHPSGYNVPPSVTWENACEAIQIHGNSFNGACDSPHHSWSFRSTMEGYRNLMVQYGAGNKKIWPTEFGWASGMLDPRYAYANDNSQQEQADWTVEAFQMMKNWGWVGPAILWNLNFRVVADGTEKAQWSIVSNNWEPLPIYHALKAMPK